MGPWLLPIFLCFHRSGEENVFYVRLPTADVPTAETHAHSHERRRRHLQTASEVQSLNETACLLPVIQCPAPIAALIQYWPARRRRSNRPENVSVFIDNGTGAFLVM